MLHVLLSLKSYLGSGCVLQNLAAEIDQKALYDTFAQFGKIVSCKLVTDADGKSKGHGYVQYEDDAAAQTAIDTVDGKELAGQQVGALLHRHV